MSNILITKKVEVFITSRNVNHYREKGYTIPMRYSEKSKKYVVNDNEPVLVEIKDLPKSSHVKIKYICDNCKQEFETTNNCWTNRKNPELGDFCKDCAAKIKLPQIMIEKYGFSNPRNVPQIKEKMKNTNLKKYGTEWAIASKQVREKSIETFVSKYQKTNPMKNAVIKEKAKATNNLLYGGNSPMCDKNVQAKSKETCMKKYGVEVSSKAKEVREKMRKTLYANGTTPTSKAELKMCKILSEIFGEENCFPSYPVGELSLDCLVLYGEEKLDFEYDGLYWHKNRQQKDCARNAILMNEGYKILRIKGNNNDEMPSFEQIKNAVDYLVKDNHHIVIIDMNN